MMAERIIFLDIDGVLVLPGSDWNFDTNSLKNLETLCKNTQAKIVISSTWREKTLIQTIRDMPPILGRLVCDQTPRLDLHPVPGYIPDPEHQTHDEIWNWLERHPEVKSYIILDDEPDRFRDSALKRCCLLQVNPQKGIDNIILQKATTMLESPWTVTDPDCNQRCRILSKTIFEYEQEDADGNTISETIDLSEYTLDEAFEKKYLAPYGYSLESVKKTYGKDWEQIIAECIFESDSY